MKFINFDLRQKKKVVKMALSLLLVGVSVIVSAPFAKTVITSATTQKKLPIYSVDTQEKKVAISFDAAWGADDTDNLLAILKEYNVKTTFFLCGYWVDKYPEEVKRIYEAGHDIGNHGNTHAHGAKLSLSENQKEIDEVTKKVKTLLDYDMDLYRPPYGEYTNTVVEAANSLNYHIVQWDVDSHDWMNKGVDYEVNQVLNHKNLKNGSIILFHNDAKDTPKALPIILKGLIEKGYEIVPISELIYKENYYMDYTGRQKIKEQ